jgi:hypothetical protein
MAECCELSAGKPQVSKFAGLPITGRRPLISDYPSSHGVYDSPRLLSQSGAGCASPKYDRETGLWRLSTNPRTSLSVFSEVGEEFLPANQDWLGQLLYRWGKLSPRVVANQPSRAGAMRSRRWRFTNDHYHVESAILRNI